MLDVRSLQRELCTVYALIVGKNYRGVVVVVAVTKRVRYAKLRWFQHLGRLSSQACGLFFKWDIRKRVSCVLQYPVEAKASERVRRNEIYRSLFFFFFFFAPGLCINF